MFKIINTALVKTSTDPDLLPPPLLKLTHTFGHLSTVLLFFLLTKHQVADPKMLYKKEFLSLS